MFRTLQNLPRASHLPPLRTLLASPSFWAPSSTLPPNTSCSTFSFPSHKLHHHTNLNTRSTLSHLLSILSVLYKGYHPPSSRLLELRLSSLLGLFFSDWCVYAHTRVFSACAELIVSCSWRTSNPPFRSCSRSTSSPSSPRSVHSKDCYSGTG